MKPTPFLPVSEPLFSPSCAPTRKSNFLAIKAIYYLALASFTLLKATAAPVAPRIKVDWPEFIGQHDLVWEETPRQWNEGAFVGNGQLGMMVYATLKDNRVDFHLGRADVTDHRKAHDLLFSRPPVRPLALSGASRRKQIPCSNTTAP